MELCKDSLRTFAKKQRKSEHHGIVEDEIKKIMRDVCLGLNELH